MSHNQLKRLAAVVRQLVAGPSTRFRSIWPSDHLRVIRPAWLARGLLPLQDAAPITEANASEYSSPPSLNPAAEPVHVDRPDGAVFGEMRLGRIDGGAPLINLLKYEPPRARP